MSVSCLFSFTAPAGRRREEEGGGGAREERGRMEGGGREVKIEKVQTERKSKKERSKRNGKLNMRVYV